MAEIVLGVGTSHGPMPSMPPDLWLEFGKDDHKHRDLIAPWDGSTVSYDEILERADPAIAKELTPERLEQRYATAQKAIATLAEEVERARPDVVVIISN